MTGVPLRGLLRALVQPVRRARALLLGPRRARVGARPRWRFRASVLNGDGIARLADLRGRALLIRFIGFG